MDKSLWTLLISGSVFGIAADVSCVQHKLHYIFLFSVSNHFLSLPLTKVNNCRLLLFTNKTSEKWQHVTVAEALLGATTHVGINDVFPQLRIDYKSIID